MKKQITLYLACLLGLVLVTSCGTRNSIVKRHYMKGYYVAKNEKGTYHHTAKSETRVISARVNDQATESRLKSIENSGATAFVPVAEMKADAQHVVIKTSAKHQRTSLLVHLVKPQLHLQQKRSLKKPVASDSDALSLFWVVILVILILWAVGFLAGGFGLGNLINLLLVIALVLLILWLLRII